MDHDGLFKMLLKNRALLRAFFEQFLPEAAKFIEFGHLEFVDKERRTLEGEKRTGDLLIKTRFKGEAACFLIHLEHQAQSRPDLTRRMLEYFVLDWREYDLPVYPVAVLSHPEPPGHGSVPFVLEFPNKRILEFDFDIIDLARLDAGVFVRGRNPAALALAARMRWDAKKRVSLVRDFFVSLASASVQREEKHVAIRFFNAYQRLSLEETRQLQKELDMIESETMREKVLELTNPFIELGFHRGIEQGLAQGIKKGIAQGIEKGIEQGRREGEAELVLRLLKRRLGPLASSQEKAICKLSLDKIELLGESLLEFKSRSDLTRWLKKNAS